MSESHDDFRGEATVPENSTEDNIKAQNGESATATEPVRAQQTTLSPGVDCPGFAPLLEAFHDEALPAEETKRVSAHLATCAWCQQQVQAMTGIDSVLRDAPMPQPGDLLRQRLQAQIAQERTRQQLPQTQQKAQPQEQTQRRKGLQRRRILVRQPAYSINDAESNPLARWPTLPGISPAYSKRGNLSWLGAVASVFIVVLLSAVLFALAPKGSGHFKSVAQVIPHSPVPTTASTASSSPLSQTPTNTAAAACSPNAVSAALPANTLLSDIAMVSASAGWAVGATRDQQGNIIGSLLLSYHHCHWQPFGETFPGVMLNSISMISDQDGWIAGGKADGSQKMLLHFSNGQWRQAPLAQGDTQSGELNTIRMQPGGNGWLVDIHNQGQPGAVSYSLYQAQQAVWSAVTSPLSWVSDIAPISTDEAWFAGQVANAGPTGVLAHELDGSWTTIPVPDNGVISELRMLAPNDGWAMGQIPGANGSNTEATALLLHYDGTTWTRMDVGAAPSAQQVLMFGDSEGWAIGVRQSTFQPADIRTVVSFIQYDRDGQWQTVAWRFSNITSVRLVRLSPTEYWGLGYFSTTAGVAHSVLLYFAGGEWHEYGN